MELLSLCVLLLLANSCLAEKCEHETDNFCRCTAGNLTVDISDLFSYPTSVKTTSPDYTYTYLPCEAKKCKTEAKKAARLCQSNGDTIFNCGVDIESGDWTITKKEPLEFTIIYTGGDGGTPRTKGAPACERAWVWGYYDTQAPARERAWVRGYYDTQATARERAWVWGYYDTQTTAHERACSSCNSRTKGAPARERAWVWGYHDTETWWKTTVAVRNIGPPAFCVAAANNLWDGV